MASQVERIKWVPGTRFMVDGFAFVNAKCSTYFLTHCHSDHTVGLSRGFCAGTIYCSAVSARLLAQEKGLRSPLVQVLPLGVPQLIDGVTVTALDANHCPGAVMLLFEVPTAAEGVGGGGSSSSSPSCDGRLTRILHTGDCRWQDELAAPLGNRPIDILMLDATYALPRYTFPSQADAIQMMVQAVRDNLAEEPHTLFVVGSYHIGKERAFLGLAQALNMKLYASAPKRKLLQLLDLPPEQLELVTDDRNAQLHVTAMLSDVQQLQALMEAHDGRWKRVVGFRPTGWSYRKSGGLQLWREGSVAVLGVPYSEHSSYSELRACVGRLRPRCLIPTVNADTKQASAAIVERFVDLMDLRGQRGRIDFYLQRSGQHQRHEQHQGEPQHPDLRLLGVVQQQRLDQQQQSDPQPQEQPADSVDCASFGASPADSNVVTEVLPRAGSVLQAATAATAAAAASPAASAAGAAQQPAEQPSGAIAGDGFDLGAVDVAEQQQLLDQVQRLQRLKRSVELRAAARKQQRSRQARLTQAGRMQLDEEDEADCVLVRDDS